jgi:succinate dehydrogenase / fumarate reductase cytochrome b subunit
MSWFADLTGSAVGKKAVMAVTGFLLFGFVLLHMIGNLKLYEGPRVLNDYAAFLRSAGEPALPATGLLWILRSVLLAAVGLHLWAAWRLTAMGNAARPVGYARRPPVRARAHRRGGAADRLDVGPPAPTASDVGVPAPTVSSGYAARTMRWGGVILLLFVIYHLLHFTWGVVHPSFIAGDVYHNVVTGFQVWWVSLFYIAAQVALGLHLYHGLWSSFQSLGWNHPRFNLWRDGFAHAFAWVITLGNISFPVAVLTGLVR